MRAEMGRAGRKKILRRAAATGVLAALLLGLVAGVVLPARAKSAERAAPAGASLEPAKPSEALCFPLGTTAFRVSDAYGWRVDPFTGAEAFHRGVDLACAEGTPVLAALGGTVTAARRSGTYGNYLCILHPGRRRSMPTCSISMSGQGRWCLRASAWEPPGRRAGLPVPTCTLNF